MIRPADPVKDAAAMARIDRGFETRSMFQLDRGARGLGLIETTLAAPLRKVFPLDDLEQPDRPWTFAVVAEEADGIVGFAAAEFRAWNRRLVLWHLYVDAPFRGRGVGRRLLAAVEAHGRAEGARHIWLETSNLNVPGFEAYRRLGFVLSGVDATLYDATDADGEFAIFMHRPIDRAAG